jgi:hypothetical protein
MNRMRQREPEQLESTAEHRRREDTAPRLGDEVKGLESLRLRFEDIRADGRMLAIAYTKPIVVATASACFDIRCMEARCNGWHDLTVVVLRALREAKTFFVGQNECSGMMGDMPCDHTLAYVCEATYSN